MELPPSWTGKLYRSPADGRSFGCLGNMSGGSQEGPEKRLGSPQGSMANGDVPKAKGEAPKAAAGSKPPDAPGNVPDSNEGYPLSSAVVWLCDAGTNAVEC